VSKRQPKRPISLRLTPTIFDRLSEASDITGVSVTSLIELCVSQRLDAIVADRAKQAAEAARRFLDGAGEARKVAPKVSGKRVAKGKL